MCEKSKLIKLKTYNIQKIDRGWIALTFFMLISTDLLVFKLAGYPVLPVLALLPLWLNKSFVLRKTIRLKLFIFYGIFIFIPFLHFQDVINWLEFWKSYSLLMMNAGILLFFCYSRAPRINSRTIGKTIKVTQVVITVYTLLQMIELTYLGSEHLWEPWGSLCASHTIPSYSKRAKAFFHEPSHLSLIAIFLFWMRFVIEKKIKVINLLHAVTIVALAKSSAGILIFTLLIGYIILLRYRYFISIPLFVGLGLALSVIVVKNQSTVEELTKVNQLQSPESVSSGYMRWILPLKIIKLHFNEGRYFGYGLGQLENDYFRKVDELFRILNVKESAVANGLLSAQIQFGLFFTFFILYAFLYRYPRMDKNWRSFMVINFICLTAGSYFQIEFYFLRFFIPLLLLSAIDKENQLLKWPKKT